MEVNGGLESLLLELLSEKSHTLAKKYKCDELLYLQNFVKQIIMSREGLR